VSSLNVLIDRVFDLLLSPIRPLPPIAGHAVISLLTAVAALLVFKATSNQLRLAAVKRAIYAALFEIRLLNDDLGAVFRAQGEILRHNLTYLRLSLVPLAWMFVPLALTIVQLEFHYGYRSPSPGESLLVKVQLRDGVEDPVGSTLAAFAAHTSGDAAVPEPAGMRVQTPAVWIPATREIIWRIALESTGVYELRGRAGGEDFSKTLDVSGDVARRSPQRLQAGFWNELLNPSEPPLPTGAAVTAISVNYPARYIQVWGWELHWSIVYGALSIVFALVLRKPLRVTL
jgi:hypothetical protein